MALKYHSICNLFPAMPADEFDALVNDIRQHGVMQAVWTWKGEIIDGKHRHKACQKLKVKCPSDEWDGKGSMVEFVTSQNLKRRHLTASQKAAVAVDMLPMLEDEAKERMLAGKPSGNNAGGSKGDSRDKAADAVGAAPRYVSDAKKLACLLYTSPSPRDRS